MARSSSHLFALPSALVYSTLAFFSWCHAQPMLLKLLHTCRQRGESDLFVSRICIVLTSISCKDDTCSAHEKVNIFLSVVSLLLSFRLSSFLASFPTRRLYPRHTVFPRTQMPLHPVPRHHEWSMTQPTKEWTNEQINSWLQWINDCVNDFLLTEWKKRWMWWDEMRWDDMNEMNEIRRIESRDVTWHDVTWEDVMHDVMLDFKVVFDSSCKYSKSFGFSGRSFNFVPV